MCVHCNWYSVLNYICHYNLYVSLCFSHMFFSYVCSKLIHVVSDLERERQRYLELHMAYDQRTREWRYQQEQLVQLLQEEQPLRSVLATSSIHLCILLPELPHWKYYGLMFRRSRGLVPVATLVIRGPNLHPASGAQVVLLCEGWG